MKMFIIQRTLFVVTFRNNTSLQWLIRANLMSPSNLSIYNPTDSWQSSELTLILTIKGFLLLQIHAAITSEMKGLKSERKYHESGKIGRGVNKQFMTFQSFSQLNLIGLPIISILNHDPNRYFSKEMRVLRSYPRRWICEKSVSQESEQGS